VYGAGERARSRRARVVCRIPFYDATGPATGAGSAALARPTKLWI